MPTYQIPIWEVNKITICVPDKYSIRDAERLALEYVKNAKFNIDDPPFNINGLSVVAASSEYFPKDPAGEKQFIHHVAEISCDEGTESIFTNKGEGECEGNSSAILVGTIEDQYTIVGTLEELLQNMAETAVFGKEVKKWPEEYLHILDEKGVCRP